LNFDDIERLDLTWIDNLETGSGRSLADPKHPDHHKDCVQEHLARYGERKCEANALIIRPGDGRAMPQRDPAIPRCRSNDAIKMSRSTGVFMRQISQDRECSARRTRRS
jgi:hypothetical protein